MFSLSFQATIWVPPDEQRRRWSGWVERVRRRVFRRHWSCVRVGRSRPNLPTSAARGASAAAAVATTITIATCRSARARATSSRSSRCWRWRSCSGSSTRCCPRRRSIATAGKSRASPADPALHGHADRMKDPLVRFGVAIEGSLLGQLDALAGERGCTRSELLRDLARGAVGRAKVPKASRRWALTLVYDPSRPRSQPEADRPAARAGRRRALRAARAPEPRPVPGGGGDARSLRSAAVDRRSHPGDARREAGRNRDHRGICAVASTRTSDEHDTSRTGTTARARASRRRRSVPDGPDPAVCGFE